MGKFVGFVGSMRGKVGTIVFTKGEKGISYGKAYQPSVANPRTPGQLAQRAKMNLVGRISAITPAALLAPLGEGTKRKNRSAYTSIMLEGATVDSSVPGTYLAKVDPEIMLFSRGGETFHATAAAPVVSANSVSVSLTLTSAGLAGLYGERIIVGVVDPSDKAGVSLLQYEDVILENTTARDIRIDIDYPLVDGSMVVVWRAPFVLTDNGVKTKSSTLYNNETEVVAAIMANVNENTAWGYSTLAATQVFTQA